MFAEATQGNGVVGVSVGMTAVGGNSVGVAVAGSGVAVSVGMTAVGGKSVGEGVMLGSGVGRLMVRVTRRSACLSSPLVR